MPKGATSEQAAIIVAWCRALIAAPAPWGEEFDGEYPFAVGYDRQSVESHWESFGAAKRAIERGEEPFVPRIPDAAIALRQPFDAEIREHLEPGNIWRTCAPPGRPRFDDDAAEFCVERANPLHPNEWSILLSELQHAMQCSDELTDLDDPGNDPPAIRPDIGTYALEASWFAGKRLSRDLVKAWEVGGLPVFNLVLSAATATLRISMAGDIEDRLYFMTKVISGVKSAKSGEKNRGTKHKKSKTTGDPIIAAAKKLHRDHKTWSRRRIAQRVVEDATDANQKATVKVKVASFRHTYRIVLTIPW